MFKEELDKVIEEKVEFIEIKEKEQEVKLENINTYNREDG